MKINNLNQSVLAFFMLCYVFVLLSCYDLPTSSVKKMDNNYIKLFNVKMKEIGGNELLFKLNTDYLNIDMDKTEVYLGNGLITTDIKNKSFRDRLEVTFSKGKYNFKTKNLSLNLEEGFLVDKNIKILTESIEYDVLNGFLQTKGGVKVVGSNFSFEGKGFSGNIKEGIFTFNDGISAKVFK